MKGAAIKIYRPMALQVTPLTLTKEKNDPLSHDLASNDSNAG
jgi:hypothetical protein